MNKYLLLLLLLLLSFSDLSSQDMEVKELVSIIYLQNNEDIKKDIKCFFKRTINHKNEFSFFYISPNIVSISLGDFREELERLIENNIDLGVDKNYFSDYKSENYSTFNKELLDILIPKKNQKLKIRFSKPVGNLLPLEIVPSISSDVSHITFGRKYVFVFIFDKQNRIIKVLSKTMIK